MTVNRIPELKALEGHRVSVSVRGGARFDDCQLVSCGRGRSRSLWLFADGADTFVALADVVDLWEAA